MATKDLYEEEMSVWLDQQQLRLKSCEISTAGWHQEIKNFRDLIKLERAQARLISKRIKKAEVELAKYLAKKRDKKK